MSGGMWDSSGSVGVSGIHLGAGRVCRCPGASRGISSIRGHWEAPRRVLGHQGPPSQVSGVHWGLAGSVGTQGPAGV